MISLFIRKIILIYAAIRSFFSGIIAGIKLIFKTKISKIILLILFGIFIIWCVGFLVFYGDIKQNWDEIRINLPEISEKTDAIVVLTGGSERIRTALHLLKTNYANSLFISGVNKKVKLSELMSIHSVSKQDLKKFGSKIYIGFEAKNTIENAREISAWIRKNPNIKSIRLVTSNYHIRRAINEVRFKLKNFKIIPHPVIPINVRIDKWWQFSGSRGLLIREYNKLIASYFRTFFERF